MTIIHPVAELDGRFSDPAAVPTAWSDVVGVLERSEVYWLTTVRANGRPHVTPLIGVLHAEVPYFCTGLREQKACNPERERRVVLTTGSNTWARGSTSSRESPPA